MVTFEVDRPKNLLVIRYHGLVRPDEVERGISSVRDRLAELESGFRLLADLTELETMDVACAPFIEQAMDLCNKKGASLVVRVIPDPQRDIGLQIMSYFHYSGDVRFLTCETLAEAEQALRD